MRGIPFYALLVLLAGASYGLVSPIIKLAYARGFSSAEVTNAGYLVSMVILWGIAFFFPRGRRISAKQWGLLVLLGLFGGLTSFTYYKALTELPASLGIVFLFQFTWMVVLIDILVTRRLPSYEKWLGLAAIVLGTFLALGVFGVSLPALPITAVIYGLLSALGYALTLYFSGYADEAVSPGLRSAIVATIATMAICIPYPPTYFGTTAIGSGLWLWAIAVALVSQVFPLLLMLIGIPRVGGRMAGVLGSIELPVAVISAHVVLNEHLTPLRWLGVVCILAGIVVSEWRVVRKSVSPQIDSTRDEARPGRA